MSVPADLLYLAAIILIAWLTGCILLAALMLSPKTRGRIQGLWPLMLSEAGILLAGTLPWLLPQPILGLALAAAAGRIGYESGAVNGGPAQPKAGSIGACLLVGIAVMAWFLDREAWPLGLVLLALCDHRHHAHDLKASTVDVAVAVPCVSSPPLRALCFRRAPV